MGSNDATSAAYKKLYGKVPDDDVRNSPFQREMRGMIMHASLAAEMATGKKDLCNLNLLKDEIIVGAVMEKVDLELRRINEEVENSKKILEKMTNDVRKASSLLQPELIKIIQRIRESRMTINLEMSKSLTIMRDVRKFFLENDHKREINRLKEFIELSEKLKALIDDGTVDAITDIILKLEGEGGK